MGRAILALLNSPQHSNEFALSAAFEHPTSDLIGTDAQLLVGGSASGTLIQSDLAALAGAQVIIDFSRPASTLALAEACAREGVALVSGTTGFSPAEKGTLLAFAKEIPLLSAPNMSVGVNLLFHLTAVAARALGESADVEITEIHHHHKLDAPSGTAQRLKEVLLEELGRTESNVSYGRHGASARREPNEIGVHTLRGGDVVGEHTVHFFGMGERIELTHRAASRDTFAAGSLRAAAFLAGKAPGVYSMQDVLQLI